LKKVLDHRSLHTLIPALRLQPFFESLSFSPLNGPFSRSVLSSCMPQFLAWDVQNAYLINDFFADRHVIDIRFLDSVDEKYCA
jgi:hypothetical protein